MMKYPSVWWVIIASIIVILMPNGTFWEIASFFILLVFTTGAILRWVKGRYGIFELRYLDPTEPLKAEHMQEYTAVRTDVGSSYFRITIRPRIGVALTKYSIAFFNKGWLPWLHGRRRSTNEIKIYKMRYNSSGKFCDAKLQMLDDEGSYSEEPCKVLAGGNRECYEFYVDVHNSLKAWEGILSFQLHFERDGNPDRRNVRTKFFVRASNRRRPIRSIFKKVLKARQIAPKSDKEGFQT